MKSHKTSRDPTFRTISVHQKAVAGLMAALKNQRRLEDKLGGKAYGGNDSKWMTSEKALDAAWRARDSAALNLVRIEPTTIDGAIALLNYFAEIAADDVPPISDQAAERLGAPFSVVIARHVARALGRIA
jgi:hypothetical protein